MVVQTIGKEPGALGEVMGFCGTAVACLARQLGERPEVLEQIGLRGREPAPGGIGHGAVTEGEQGVGLPQQFGAQRRGEHGAELRQRRWFRSGSRFGLGGLRWRRRG